MSKQPHVWIVESEMRIQYADERIVPQWGLWSGKCHHYKWQAAQEINRRRAEGYRGKFRVCKYQRVKP